MIKDFDYNHLDNSYSNFQRKDLAEQLAVVQRQCQYLNIPVIIVVDGFESSGKGFVINELVRELDTKHFVVHVFESLKEEDLDRPYTWRLWTRIPPKGDFAVFDRSHYHHVKMNPNLSKKEINKQLEHLMGVENTLLDDGKIILKFFLMIKEETQTERLAKLEKDEDRDFLVDEFDRVENENYKCYLKHYDHILNQTGSFRAPWHIVSGEDMKDAAKCVLGLSIKELQKGIDRILASRTAGEIFVRDYQKNPTYLQDLRTDLTLPREEYDDKLETLQKKAQQIAYRMFKLRIPTVLVFEGMDAAGKGGAIKRLTKLIDPRGYRVNPTAAPSEVENSRHYLWRFYLNFPKKSRMTIFDRSWYGRVMVERVEGFASPAQWERAYDEINDMESELVDFNTLVIKYFLYIDKDEQLMRFKSRQEAKPYKLTDEDWRNRDKWDEYLKAMNEMIDRTNTKDAPWVLVEGNDKYYARVKILEDFVTRAEAICERVEAERNNGNKNGNGNGKSSKKEVITMDDVDD